MGDMGLAGMGGAAGAGDALQTLFQERMQAAAAQRAQKQLEQNDALMRMKAQEHADEVAQNLEFKRQAEKDRTDAAKASADTRNAQQARTTYPLLPMTGISASTQQQMTGPGQMPTELFPVTPTSVAAPPESIAAPDQPQGLTPIPGTIANSPAPMARTFDRIQTPAEAQTSQSTADKVEAARLAAENRTNDNEQRAKDRLAQIAAAGANRPVSTVTIQTQDDQGHNVTRVVPKSEAIGKTYKKGVSGATETRLASAEAVNQTGEDIIKQLSDPKVAASLGPAMGRYNSVREWVGNPPPELSELAGAIESYALANMGVHGMRSAQGAEQIKKLLDKKHTPESLASTIRGLSKFSEHFMQNEGRGGSTAPTAGGGSEATAPPAPDGWKYVPKPGGGWTAVKATP